MSRDDNGTNYFGFLSHLALNGTCLINFNRVFNGFVFIFSNSRRVHVLLLSVKPKKIRNFQKWKNFNKNNKLP